jgi:hypothetical protein
MTKSVVRPCVACASKVKNLKIEKGNRYWSIIMVIRYEWYIAQIVLWYFATFDAALLLVCNPTKHFVKDCNPTKKFVKMARLYQLQSQITELSCKLLSNITGWGFGWLMYAVKMYLDFYDPLWQTKYA